MKTNIHPMERVIRIFLGLLLISFVFWGPTSAWFLVGIVPLLTGVFGWCPPYALFGINTCSIKKM